jgi:hypothetical protein
MIGPGGFPWARRNLLKSMSAVAVRARPEFEARVAHAVRGHFGDFAAGVGVQFGGGQHGA